MIRVSLLIRRKVVECKACSDHSHYIKRLITSSTLHADLRRSRLMAELRDACGDACARGWRRAQAFLPTDPGQADVVLCCIRLTPLANVQAVPVLCKSQAITLNFSLFSRASAKSMAQVLTLQCGSKVERLADWPWQAARYSCGWRIGRRLLPGGSRVGTEAIDHGTCAGCGRAFADKVDFARP